jgi:hypothetical protein
VLQIITPPAETSDIFLRCGGGEPKRVEANDFELRAAGGAGENLAAIDVEFRDRYRVTAGGAGGQARLPGLN